ncbi:MAG: polysaccharide deacetylase family protein, partial [Aliifodinibius sp.]|nr:polysaccharide deacetylase family protein [candidate division Zixibacteria bacterium]NIT56491.1 polysaccharide deacetylase family protein [Fodinibius sp.]NIY25074.1 polysaccharide deacetylase family protein [Fodinibius sp.]
MKAKLKRIIKFLISIIMYYSGMLYLYSRLKTHGTYERKLKILMYHSVLNDNDKLRAELQPGMCVLQSTFEKQVRYLSKKYEVISIEKLFEMVSQKRAPDKSTAVITFDDGWRDNYDYAFPVLMKCNCP